LEIVFFQQGEMFMPGFVVFLVVFVFAVIAANVIVLIIRSGKNRSPYGRRGKKAPLEEREAIIRDNEVHRRIYLEQERIKRYLELRSKTWALYDEVRQKHKGDN
jgi:hypothetical protein